MESHEDESKSHSSFSKSSTNTSFSVDSLDQDSHNIRIHKEVELKPLLDLRALKRNLCSSVIALIFIILGALGVFLGHVMRSNCTLISIDYYALQEDRMSNIPKWFMISGIAFMTLGIIGCLSVGVCPLLIRAQMPLCGNMVADIMTGPCFMIFLFISFVIVTVVNIMGTLWLYVASLNPKGYQNHLDECSPILWYSAHVITKSYWVITVFGAISLGAKFYVFLRGNEVTDPETEVKKSKPYRTKQEKKLYEFLGVS